MSLAELKQQTQQNQRRCIERPVAPATLEHDDAGQRNEAAEQLDAVFQPGKKPEADEDEDPLPSMQERVAPDTKSSMYHDYWIGVVEKMLNAGDERQSQIMMSSALKQSAANSAVQPDPLDQAIFKQCGSGELQYRDVSHYLKLSRASQIKPPSHSTMVHWQAIMRFAPDTETEHWQKTVTQFNANAGANQLSDAQLELAMRYPQWIAGWMRCEKFKAEIESNLSKKESCATTNRQIQSTQQLPQLKSNAIQSRYRSQHVAQMSLAEQVGSGLVAPLKFAGDVSASIIAHAQHQLWRYRQHSADRLIQESEQQLTKLEALSQRLKTLPDATDALKNPDLLQSKPDLRRALDDVYTAYDRVAEQWQRCTHQHHRLNKTWQPSDAQIQRLQQACQNIPDDERFQQTLLEQAQAMVKALQELVHWMVQQRQPDLSPTPVPVQPPHYG